ncbi:DNA polymerase Y family protein [Schlesneria sp.]|uniref:DNA polymerase Y family protein n=1 Tax=Schlesneria sp. TaxID=2762018 RepID=UPI002F253485
MRRVMCVWYPLWPVQHLRCILSAKSPDEPLRTRLREPAVNQGDNAKGRGAADSISVREGTQASAAEASPAIVTPWNSTQELHPDASPDQDQDFESESLFGSDHLPSPLLGEPMLRERFLPREKPALRPVILFDEGRRGYQVVVCSPEALQWGVRVGMPIGEVRSLLPGASHQNSGAPHLNRRKATSASSAESALLQRVDHAADRLKLQELARYCHRYSPLVGLEETATPESLWLEISGSEVLFGGEQKLAETVQTDMARQGIHVRVAIADSWGAAWGVSHFGEADLSLIPPGEQREWLASLPVGALRISETVRQSLETLDITRISQLYNLPRTTLPARFGKELLLRMDQALGHAPELLVAERQSEPLFTEWLFEEPIDDRQTLDHVCEVLLERLLVRLTERQAGLRELQCHWLGTTADPTVLRMLRPVNEKRHLLELLRLQNERRVFLSNVQGVRMEAAEIGLPPVRQTTLFDDDTADRQPQLLAELVDRLSIRLSCEAVLNPRLKPDPQPEFACEPVPWLDAKTPTDVSFSSSGLRCRPLRLLHPPRPLVVEKTSTEGLPGRVHHSSVIRISGPERIEGGWWRDVDAKRDYYQLDLANGTRLWAFVERDTGNWFLHGLFA